MASDSSVEFRGTSNAWEWGKEWKCVLWRQEEFSKHRLRHKWDEAWMCGDPDLHGSGLWLSRRKGTEGWRHRENPVEVGSSTRALGSDGSSTPASPGKKKAEGKDVTLPKLSSTKVREKPLADEVNEESSLHKVSEDIQMPGGGGRRWHGGIVRFWGHAG